MEEIDSSSIRSESASSPREAPMESRNESRTSSRRSKTALVCKTRFPDSSTRERSHKYRIVAALIRSSARAKAVLTLVGRNSGIGTGAYCISPFGIIATSLRPIQQSKHSCYLTLAQARSLEAGVFVSRKSSPSSQKWSQPGRPAPEQISSALESGVLKGQRNQTPRHKFELATDYPIVFHEGRNPVGKTISHAQSRWHRGQRVSVSHSQKTCSSPQQADAYSPARRTSSEVLISVISFHFENARAGRMRDTKRARQRDRYFPACEPGPMTKSATTFVPMLSFSAFSD